jgi:hypothetical protein
MIELSRVAVEIAYVRVALQELINPQIVRLIEESLVAEAAAISAIDEKANDFMEIRRIALRAADVIAGKIAERGFPNDALEQGTAEGFFLAPRS